MTQAKKLFSYRKYWAECYGHAPFLPMSREEMDALGWDSCDIILVTGDAYVDHPSFGMAVIGRTLEDQGFRVGIIAQPDWHNKDDFLRLGKPNLFFGVAAGNMDSMINHYTADKKRRSDDAYTAGNIGGKRPDRAVTVYAQRCREAFKGVPIVIGSIEASLRRLAHYDYWSDTVKRSVLMDSKADMLLFGNAERAIIELAHRLADGEPINTIRDIRGTGFMLNEPLAGFSEIDSTHIDTPGVVEPHINPYQEVNNNSCAENSTNAQNAADKQDEAQPVKLIGFKAPTHDNKDSKRFIRLPSYEQVKKDPTLYAHTSRIFHLETNPGNARALVQQHGNRLVWLNPPPIPLTTEEMDHVFELPYQRHPHPVYGDASIPAYEMIRFSINIMRGCFGGCTFCSITEHEGRIIQNRSEESIVKEVEIIRDTVKGFTGTISDLGGPTANMWRLACNDAVIEKNCRRLSCVYPGICKNLNTDQTPLVSLYKKTRELKGIKRVLIASGLRYDLAVKNPEYVKELVTHHVGGYLKIAPEHTEDAPLSKMMKPGIGAYDEFKVLFDRYTEEAGKKQYLIPYFIAGHPGTTDEDMLNLALWLKEKGFRADQVQSFYPSPMANATTMYHSEKNPLRKVSDKSDAVISPKGIKQRRLHKAFLRYHDANNWPLLRDALKRMGRQELIGSGKHQLIPRYQPKGVGLSTESAIPAGKKLLTQHTGLPPRDNGAGKKPRKSKHRVKRK